MDAGAPAILESQLVDRPRETDQAFLIVMEGAGGRLVERDIQDLWKICNHRRGRTNVGDIAPIESLQDMANDLHSRRRVFHTIVDSPTLLVQVSPVEGSIVWNLRVTRIQTAGKNPVRSDEGIGPF